MSRWTGEFVPLASNSALMPTEAKGLEKLKKKKNPESTTVKKDIEKVVRAEKISASKAENLLRKNLIDKEFDLIFSGTDRRQIYLIKPLLFGPDFDDTAFKEAAVDAQIHLNNTYGKYKASSGAAFGYNAALAPFATGELSARQSAAAKLYMWFLFGEDERIASDLFGDVVSRERGSTDLVDFVDIRGCVFNGDFLSNVLPQYDNWTENVIYHSFESVFLVCRLLKPADLEKLVGEVMATDVSSFRYPEKVNAFCILLESINLRSSFSDAMLRAIYDFQILLARNIFRLVKVEKTRLMFQQNSLPKFWIHLAKLLVAEEKISSENLIFIVSEMQRRGALSEQDETELLDAQQMLQLTSTLDNATITERRGGFQFRG